MLKFMITTILGCGILLTINIVKHILCTCIGTEDIDKLNKLQLCREAIITASLILWYVVKTIIICYCIGNFFISFM